MRNARFFNNIWSDPSGSMQDFSDTPPADTQSFSLDYNLYYNGGQPIPSDAAELVNPDDDANRVVDNPELAANSSVILPRWNPQASNFGAGSATICQAFARLAEQYCVPAAGSPALNAASAANSPNHDLVRRTRPVTPAIGACETTESNFRIDTTLDFVDCGHVVPG